MIYYAAGGSFLVFVFWVAGVVWGINLLFIIVRYWIKWLKDWWEEEKEERRLKICTKLLKNIRKIKKILTKEKGRRDTIRKMDGEVLLYYYYCGLI